MGIEGKKAVLGEALATVQRFMVIAFVTTVILGASIFFYAHHIDIRDAEARILTRNIIDCLAPQGMLNEWALTTQEETLLEHCNLQGGQTERYYIKIEIQEEEKTINTIEQGDEGSTWTKQLYDTIKQKTTTEEIRIREPGYTKNTYPIKHQNNKKGNINIETLIQKK